MEQSQTENQVIANAVIELLAGRPQQLATDLLSDADAAARRMEEWAASLERLVVCLTTENASLRTQITQSTLPGDRLQKVVELCEAGSKQIEELTKERDEAKASGRRSQEQVAIVEAELRRLSEFERLAVSRLEEIAKLEVENEDLRIQDQRLGRIIEGLRDDLRVKSEKLQEAQSKNSQAVNKITEQGLEIEQLRKDVEGWKAGAAAGSKTLDELRHDLAISEAHAEGAKRAASILEKSNEALAQERDALRSQLNSVAPVSEKTIKAVKNHIGVLKEVGCALIDQLPTVPEPNCSCHTGCAPCTDCSDNAPLRDLLEQWTDEVKKEILT